MVRTGTPSPASPPLSNSNPSLLNLSNAAPNVTVIPPNLHEAFSLAGAYHENIPLSSYANLNAWQTPWYNNLFSSTAIRAFNIHQASLPPHERQGPIGSEPVGNENQSPLNSNSNHPITSNLPLSPHLLGTYNNYLAPNFGSLLTPNSPITSPIAPSVPHPIPNNLQMQALPPLPPTTQTNHVLRSLTLPVNNGRQPPANNNHSGGPVRTRHPATRGSRSSNSNRHCDCPICTDLARRGLPIDRRNEKHNCHVPGCMKVYGKSSHLKAHLRWHNAARPSVNKRTVKAAAATVAH